ncbi:MAG: glycerol-3-phosphate 1-O-acyltransferase PlsY [Acholeplasmatales bacterium]|nr:glycerol-3-phosphate 1-O-acyltransferase PlsY [Acholeplasmatales bacterium]
MILTETVDAWNIVISIILMIVSYLLGSIPFGVLVGKAATGVDIREHGSKNIGSTNAIRVLGKKVGAIVFLCDVLKGAFVIIILKILAQTNLWHSVLDYGYYGMMAVIGHSFSIFLKFKGGKAVATSLGVVLCICPLAGILCLVTFAVVLFSTGYVSLASTFATLAVLLTYIGLFIIGYEATNFFDYFISAPSLENLITILVPGVIIIYKHIPNYKRLFNGTENCFKKKPEEENNEENSTTEA